VYITTTNEQRINPKRLFERLKGLVSRENITAT